MNHLDGKYIVVTDLQITTLNNKLVTLPAAVIRLADGLFSVNYKLNNKDRTALIPQEQLVNIDYCYERKV